MKVTWTQDYMELGCGGYYVRRDVVLRQNSRGSCRHILISLSFMLGCRVGFLHGSHSAKWLPDLRSSISVAGMTKQQGQKKAAQGRGGLFVLELQVIVHYCRKTSQPQPRAERIRVCSLSGCFSAFCYIVQGPAHDMVPILGSSHLG